MKTVSIDELTIEVDIDHNTVAVTSDSRFATYSVPAARALRDALVALFGKPVEMPTVHTT